MLRCKLPSLAGGLVVLAFAVAACDQPSGRAGSSASVRATPSPEDMAILEKAKASGAWNGEPMPGLTLERTRRQVVYEAKIGAVVQKLMSDPSKTSTNEFGSRVINTDGVPDLPTILGEAGYKDYMANVKAINLAEAAEAIRQSRR